MEILKNIKKDKIQKSPKIKYKKVNATQTTL